MSCCSLVLHTRAWLAERRGRGLRVDLQTWLHVGGARRLRGRRWLCGTHASLSRDWPLRGSIAAVGKRLHECGAVQWGSRTGTAQPAARWKALWCRWVTGSSAPWARDSRDSGGGFRDEVRMVVWERVGTSWDELRRVRESARERARVGRRGLGGAEGWDVSGRGNERLVRASTKRCTNEITRGERK